MAGRYIPHPSAGYNRVHGNEQKRACRIPERTPGVAPACEDDKIQTPGEYARGRPVTLPEVKWLSRGKP